MKKICGLLMALSVTAAMPAWADAFNDLKKRAESGDTTSQVFLADEYLREWGLHYDPAEGEKWLLKAAEEGDSYAENQLGNLYVISDKTKALGWYEKAATHGLVTALKPVCTAYLYGDIVEVDWNKLITFCQKAADNDIVVGLTAMGVVYAEGRAGVTADPTKALDDLNQANDLNEPYAAEYLGRLNLQGDIVTQDYTKSADLFRKAMGYGRVKAAAYLAQQYELGLGFQAEPREASRLYMLAATEGQTDASTWLKLHPDITPETISANEADPFKDPANTWTVLKNVDAQDQYVDISTELFGGISSYYPDRAINDEVEGDVVVECRWNDNGNLDNCALLHESPKNYGFGQATLKFFERPFNVVQKEAWKDRVRGKFYRGRLKWKLS